MLKGEIPFVRFLLPYLLGIITAGYLPTEFPLWLILIFQGILSAILILSLSYYKKLRLYRFRWILGIIIHFLLFFAAYSNTVFQSGLTDKNYFTRHPAKILLVKINTEPAIKGDIARFEAAVLFANQTKVNGSLLIALKTDPSRVFNFNYGDLLLIPANYHEVEPPYNPGEFNYKAYLQSRQIRQQSFINQNQIRKIASGYGNPIIQFALNLRQKIVTRFKQYLANPEAAALASTLIMGYRADLSPEIVSAYSKTGTMHVLSVSGMHVALVFLMLGFLLKPLDKIPRMRFLKAFILIGMIWFYALITGFSPSVNRAALMLSFVVLGKTISKNMNTYNLLAISAFILLLIYPFYLFDIGFQLSYLAVYGLVFLHPHIYSLWYVKPKILDAAWSYTSLSLAAQLITFPLSLYIFHQFPLYFLISNLLIVIPVTGIMYVGIAFVIFLAIPAVLPYFGWILNQLINFTNQSLYIIENLPFASLQGIFIDEIQFILLYLLIFFIFLAFMYKNKSLLFGGLITALLFFGLTFCYQIKAAQKQELVLFSLRKNMAIAYIHGSEYELISDLKPEDKAYQFSVKPYLDRAGLSLKKQLKPDEKYYSTSCCSNGNLIQFGYYRLFRWTLDYNYKKLSKPIQADAVLLSGNPIINLLELKKSVRFKNLFIDATNPDYKIKQWMEEAEKLNIPCHVLKKNPAVLLKL